MSWNRPERAVIEGEEIPFSIYTIRKPLPDGQCYGFVYRGGKKAETTWPLYTQVKEYGLINPFAFEHRLDVNVGNGFWTHAEGTFSEWKPNPWVLAKWDTIPRVWQAFLLNALCTHTSFEAACSADWASRRTQRRLEAMREEMFAVRQAFLARESLDFEGEFCGRRTADPLAITRIGVRHGSRLYWDLKEQAQALAERRRAEET